MSMNIVPRLPKNARVNRAPEPKLRIAADAQPAQFEPDRRI
jgi:hypothetical protein